MISHTDIAPSDYTVIAPTLTGTVKWFNNKAGFGFITVCCECEYKNKDIFVHYSSIRVSNSQYKYLVQGEYVNFTLIKANHDHHEFQAMNVCGIEGGPIMCEAKAAYGGGSRVLAPFTEGRRPAQSRRPAISASTPSPASIHDDELGYVRVQKRRPRGGAPTA